MPYLFLLLLIAVILIFFIPNRFFQLPEEKGKKPIYEESGISSIFSSGPMLRGGTRFAIYDEFIVVINPFNSLLLKWQEIDKVDIGQNWHKSAYTGLNIYSKRNDLPQPISLYLKDDEKVKNLINSRLKK